MDTPMVTRTKEQFVINATKIAAVIASKDLMCRPYQLVAVSFLINQSS